MHLLLDLDGTLVDTNSSNYDNIKNGRNRNFDPGSIPLLPSALEFVLAAKQCGHSVTIVSDSHQAYVGPIAEQIFGAHWLALADKPNVAKLRVYLNERFGFPDRTFAEEFLFVGDTRLDVQVARGLAIPSALLVAEKSNFYPDAYHDTGANRARSCMEGATYTRRSFDELLRILETPAQCRLSLEDPVGTSAVRLIDARNRNGGHTIIRGLGRQQRGPCDAYGAIGRYYKFGSEDRTDGFLAGVARDASRYLKAGVLSQNFAHWDLVTCVADKETTKPPRKMAKLLHALDIDLPKVELFTWSPDVTGSIRQEKTRAGRMDFLKRFVRMENDADLAGKSIIVIDDQFTTGATAMSHTHMLLDAGVKNILFVALFYLTEEVAVEKICPSCGEVVRIKYRKRDGMPFYNCVPPSYNGTGCGWMGNVNG